LQQRRFGPIGAQRELEALAVRRGQPVGAAIRAGVVGLEHATTLKVARRAERERTDAIFMMGSLDFLLQQRALGVCPLALWTYCSSRTNLLEPAFFRFAGFFGVIGFGTGSTRDVSGGRYW